jgi:hypothetical protein
MRLMALLPPARHADQLLAAVMLNNNAAYIGAHKGGGSPSTDRTIIPFGPKNQT